MALFQGCTAKAGGVLPRALDPSSLEPGAATYEVRWLGGHHASQRGLVWHRPRLPVMPCQVPNTVMNKPWRLQLISPSSQVTLDVQVFPAKATGSSQDKPSAIPAVPRLNAHSQNSWTYYNSHRYSCFRVLRLEVICDRRCSLEWHSSPLHAKPPAPNSAHCKCLRSVAGESKQPSAVIDITMKPQVNCGHTEIHRHPLRISPAA